MPTFEYKRSDGTIFECKQGMNDDPLTTCPETGLDCTRLISGGLGPLLPHPKTVKYKDGNFINSKLARELEKNPFYSSLPSKAKTIKENTEKNRQKNAEMKRKITGQISEI